MMLGAMGFSDDLGVAVGVCQLGLPYHGSKLFFRGG